jgi:hypothetical protein
MIYKYTNIDINKIKFSDKPYNKLQYINIGNKKLEKNVYYIDMYYNNDALYIQLPKTKLYLANLDNNVIKIIIDDKINDNFIKKLEEYIIKVVYKNSELWFDGKIFTMNKIINCIVRNVNYIEENIILTLTLDNECKIFNQYGVLLDIKELDIKELDKNVDIVCIIKIDNLQFIDNKFTYNIVLEQAKIYKDTKITEYSILDDDSVVSNESNTTISKDLDDEYYKKTD